MISPKFEAMYSYRFLHVFVVDVSFEMSDSTYLRNAAKQKQQKNTPSTLNPSEQNGAPIFVCQHLKKSRFFVARDQQQSTVFVWRWTAEVARLPKIEAPAWLKGSELVFLLVIFLRIPRTIWVRISILLHGFFRLQFKQSQKSHVFFRNYTWVNDNGYLLFYGSFRNGVFQPLFALEKGDGSLESGTPGETDGWRSGQ